MIESNSNSYIDTMKFIFSVIGLVLLIHILFSPYAFASDSKNTPQITGDAVNVDLENKIIWAKGNIILKYKEIAILCDDLKIDAVSGELYAEGNIEFYDKDDKAIGESLTYNLLSQSGILEPGYAIIQGDKMEDPMYIKGKGFHTEPGSIYIKQGRFTTCDLETPHYQIEAEEIKIYIGDKIELRQVYYREGKFRIFYLPYLVLPLKEENRFEMPQIGYGLQEGWFIKTTYNYYRNPKFRGFLYLDYYNRLGLGLGVKHLYDLGVYGVGSLYLYELIRKDRSYIDSGLELIHTLSLGDKTTCSINIKCLDNPFFYNSNTKDISGKAKIIYSDDKKSADISIGKSYTVGSIQSDETEIELAGKWNTENELSLSGNFKFFERNVSDKSQINDKYFNYQVNARKNFENVSLQVISEQYVKPAEIREKEEEGEIDPLPYEAIGRAPEIRFEGRPFELGVFPLKLKWNVVYGRYGERTSPWFFQPVTSGSKLHLGVAGLEKVYPIGNKTKATLSAGCGFDNYTTGDSRCVAESVLSLETKGFNDTITISGKYDYCGVFGDTPFAFDKIERKGLLTGRLALSKGIFFASIDSGYDFYTNTYRDITVKVRLSQEKTWSLEGFATYDPEYRHMHDAIGKLEFIPSDNCLVRIGARYSFLKEALDRIESHVAFEVSDAWKLGWTVVYGGATKSKGSYILKGDVAIARDMHCRELRLSYSYTLNQVWLEYRIKAFPYDSIKMGFGEEGVLF